MIAGTNRVIIKTKKSYDDTFQTESGMTFYKDPTIRKEFNAVTRAEVVATPMSMNTRRPLIIPGIEATVKDIAPEVEVGDMIHFRYGVIYEDDDSKWPENLVRIDGEYRFYMVFYDEIVAIERGDEIIPVGGHVLMDPIDDKEEDSVIINPYIDKRKDRGLVRYIGTNLSGRKPVTTAGTQVTFRKYNTQSGEPEYVDINGHRYWVVYQDEILAVDEHN